MRLLAFWSDGLIIVLFNGTVSDLQSGFKMFKVPDIVSRQDVWIVNPYSKSSNLAQHQHAQPNGIPLKPSIFLIQNGA